LFGVSPPGRRFVYEKSPNKLGTPTLRAFFNKVIETKRLSPKPLGFDTLSAGFDKLNPSRYELLNRRSLALA